MMCRKLTWLVSIFLLLGLGHSTSAAASPHPPDGATEVSTDVTLSWDSEYGVISYDVYFGTSNPPELTGNQDANSYDPGTLEPGTTYFWQINEVNDLDPNNPFLWEGDVWSFTTTKGPKKATNPSPADGAEDVPLDTGLSWDPGSGATSQDVYFGTSSSPPFVDNQTQSDYSPGTLEPDTRYWWQIDTVRQIGEWFTVVTGDLWSFTTAIVEATDPYPADGAEDVPLDIVLSWNPGSGATSQDVYFGTSSSPPLVASQTQSDYSPGTLEPDTRYWWHIDEIEADGTVVTGDVWSFTTVIVEATNPYPADGAEDVSIDVALSWTAGFGATSHDVYFGTSSPPAFIYRTANGYSPGGLEPGTTYFWQINEVVPVMEGPPIIHEGPVWEFTTVSGPVEATNPSPADGAEDVSTDVVLSWKAGFGAESHDVYFGTSSPPPFIGNQTASYYEPYYPYGLEPCTTYYWKINEVVPVMEGPPIIHEGDVWEFTTMSGSVEATNPSPADGAIGVSSAPLLSTYISSDVPLNIPDRGRVETTVFSSLDIPGSLTITDLNVQLDITMPVNNADLNVFLIGPDGTRVELFTDVGITSKDYFKNTVLDDEASISVRDGRGNFAGTYRPEGKLSDFDGKNAQGTWTLEITDDWANNVGTLNSWQLIIESTNIISWIPGDGIASQDVYFSNNFNEVNDSAEAAYQGNFAADVSTIEVVLDPDQTYFWRIDSLDADGMLIVDGDIWSFTTGLAAPARGDMIQVTNDSVFKRTLSDLIVYGDPNDPNEKKVILKPNDPNDDIVFGPGMSRVFDADFKIKKYIISSCSMDEGHYVEHETVVFEIEKIVPKKLACIEIGPYIQEQLKVILEIDQSIAPEPPPEGTVLVFSNGQWEKLSGPYGGWFVGTGINYDTGEVTGAYTGTVEVFCTAFEVLVFTPPYPPDGAVDIPLDVKLYWPVSEEADWYDVYFGTDRDAVANANPGSPEYKGRLAFYDDGYSPGGLEWCTTYYWRTDGVIEEIDEPPDEWPDVPDPNKPPDDEPDPNKPKPPPWPPVPLPDPNEPPDEPVPLPPPVPLPLPDPNQPPIILESAITPAEGWGEVVYGPIWSFTTGPAKATNPYPIHCATDVDPNVILSWTPGCFAAFEDVYFGTDFYAVANADTSDTTGIYRARRDANSYDPGGLEVCRTYYWRTDGVEADGTIHTGDVWSFKTVGHLVLDDFESYSDVIGNRIFETWKDGWGYSVPPDLYHIGNLTGSRVDIDSVTVHEGTQSMKFDYDNTGTSKNIFGLTVNACYSETERAFDVPQDWTTEGAEALSLCFHGDPTNDPEPIYMALADSTGTLAVVYHDNLDAARIDTWTEWNIDLKDFADQGVNLADVNSIAIGFGTKGNMTTPGGSGKMSFDSIVYNNPMLYDLISAIIKPIIKHELL